MPSAMKFLSCLGLLLALATLDAGAEQRSGGNLGSILLDRCTGNSWVLARTRLGDGRETTRWFPLTVEKTEIVLGGGPGAK